MRKASTHPLRNLGKFAHASKGGAAKTAKIKSSAKIAGISAALKSMGRLTKSRKGRTL